MSFRSLRRVPRPAARRKGDLKRITREVDWRYEVTEIACREAKAQGPALLFENVRGARFPLAVNVLAATRRDRVGARAHAARGGRRDRGDLPRAAAAAARATCGRCAAARGACSRSRPTRVERGPAQEHVAGRGPRARCRSCSCGPATAGASSRSRSCSPRIPRRTSAISASTACTCTTQTTTGMHWQIGKGGGFHYHKAEKRGEALEVAVAVGADPATLLAGGRAAARGHRRAGVRGLPARRADAPRARAHAHDARARRRRVRDRGRRARGRAPQRGTVRRPLRALLARRAVSRVPRARASRTAARPVFQASVVGKPPQEDKFMGEAVQEMFTGVLKVIHPEIVRPVGVLRGRLPQPARGGGRESLREGGQEDRARPDGHRPAVAHQGDRAGGRRREPARPRARCSRRSRGTSIPPRTSCCCPACRSTRSTSPAYTHEPGQQDGDRRAVARAGTPARRATRRHGRRARRALLDTLPDPRAFDDARAGAPAARGAACWWCRWRARAARWSRRSCAGPSTRACKLIVAVSRGRAARRRRAAAVGHLHALRLRARHRARAASSRAARGSRAAARSASTRPGSTAIPSRSRSLPDVIAKVDGWWGRG